MGLKVPVPPTATFYIWLDLSKLDAPLNNGLTFFEELLKVWHVWHMECDGCFEWWD